MSNPCHVILHVDTDAAATWSEHEVIERWARLFSTPVLVERCLRGQNSSEAADNKGP